MKSYQFISAAEASNYDAALIVLNVEKVYNVMAWLERCIAKKLCRGIEPDFEQLAASSTVGKMLTMIDRELLALDCPKMTKEERKEIRGMIANNVLYSAQEEMA